MLGTRRFFRATPDLCIPPKTTVRRTMEIIDKYATGIALVVSETGQLIATVTDGDVRRALLRHVDLECSIEGLLQGDPQRCSPPVTAPAGTQVSALLAMMTSLRVQQIPLVDEAGRVIDLALLKDLQTDASLPIQALIMAGGFGTRLLPLTEKCPKPMLSVGGRPILELTLERLLACGIRNVNIATHYLPEQIVSHFGDGSKFGVNLRYLQEESPLGTGGALSLFGGLTETTLIINGDIITDLDFRAMRQFHSEHGADVTVGVVSYEIQIPYGIVHHHGAEVTRLVEKPVTRHFINAGIYLVEPRVNEFFAPGTKFTMPDLIDRVIAAGRRAVAFPVKEYWIDVGQPSDYERVQNDLKTGRIKAAVEASP